MNKARNKPRKISLFILMTFVLLSSGLLASTRVIPGTSHGEEPVTEYDGPTIIIPFVNETVSVDGRISSGEYPEPGHLTLEGYPEEIKFMHNSTHLFVAITQEATALLAGIGIHPIGGHDEGGSDSITFTYFAATQKNNTFLDSQVIISDQDFEIIEGQENGNKIFKVSREVTGTDVIFEFAIPLSSEFEVKSGISSTRHAETPDVGSIFHVIVLSSNQPNIQQRDEMNLSGLVPMYLLRPGESVEQVEKLFAKETDWIQAAVIPGILVILTLFTVYSYLPRRRKESLSN